MYEREDTGGDINKRRERVMPMNANRKGRGRERG